ncbi:Fpg/Nei family DNA glycosylase [Aestuariimicrobium sp. p3-SID1156]|uniref:Fpg/Nei family DNA glycosylase n=1 Tax=Aestuariimicrobium sp. p3-SID1156 TaxID=2916038 RepID=UPI00223A95BA|nr:DNA-formamidopyrimidine glycosylase family protein [Aestuariimicrobium sp. p3-SID1156]MCT1459759.1 Fpg/Nei family DNA glycosylase [Aestuariimicrobium sp. p3-SID1156]
MPEGHAIHRLAHELNDAFAGQRVHVSSPQGRFEASAELVDGSTLLNAEAWGKNLFLEFGARVPEPIIHIHLGLIGTLRIAPLSPPVGEVRLRLTDGRLAADLRGPQTCALVSPQRREEIVAKLGPDPIREDADPERGFARVQRSKKSIATLLMDQKVAAGVGNIFRAEVLFRHRRDPRTPGHRISRREWDAIWADLVAMMRQATDDGRIDSVLPEHMPEAMGRDPRVDPHGGEVYVYRRVGQPCLVCGDEIRSEIVESRNLYWCPTCQRRH